MQGDLRVERLFVGVVDAGEAFDLAAASFRIHSFGITPFAYLDGGVDEDFDEIVSCHLTRFVARLAEGADGSADHGAVMAGDLTSDEADAQDVGVAVFLAETEAFGEVGTDDIAVQDSRLATMLEQHGDQRLRYGGLARTAQACKPDAHALLVTWRVDFCQDLGGLFAGEPLGERFALGKIIIAHLCAGDRGDLGTRRDFAYFLIALFIHQVYQLFEGHRGNAGLFGILGEHFLGFIGAVEGLAGAVDTRTSMVAADDEMRGAMIAADDGVPDGLTRPTHAHRQGQQAEHGLLLFIIVVHQRLVGAHAGKVVDITRLGHANHGMDQQTTAHFLGGALGQLLVDAVHGVAGLEGNHFLLPHLGEQGTYFAGGAAQLDEVIISRTVQDLQLA